MSAASPASEVVTYPGARAPDRRRTVDSHGVRLAVHEWGDVDAPPVMLAHGGFDFARTYDVFAPLLADAGWRVVSWDQRGHGDSEQAAMYSWEADLRDALAVVDSVGQEPLPVIGHSKGGAVMVQFAIALPHRLTRLVNLDGLPGGSMPDVSDRERTKLVAGELAGWLDFRRSVATKSRRPDTLDGLATRRAAMNPRLSHEWLRYLVSVGGRHDADGWRWKIDPALRLGGFGPWRPEWAMARLPSVGVPMLAVVGRQPEVMGWATPVDVIERHLPPGSRLVVVEEVGHFVHIEQPARIADLALDFLGRPADEAPAPGPASARPPAGAPATPANDGMGAAAVTGATGMTGGRAEPAGVAPTVTLRHNKVDLALHRLRAGAGRPLLHLHGLAERSPTVVPDHLAAWPGPVWGLDFTGHGDSTRPAGGGYFCELLMGDADAALGHLGPATLYGRGLGAYVALMTAGARPDLVRGAILDDGPGLAGGGVEPSTPFVLPAPLPATPGAPDPYALLDLAHDVRPADYAATYARQAATLSGLDVAILVSAVVRPPWLAAVAAEPGVQSAPRETAIETFAAVE